MLTIKVQTNKKAAEKYMEDHLSKGEYYSEGEDHTERLNTPPLNSPTLDYYNSSDQMKWHGSLVKTLGLDPSKAITNEEFSRLLENKNPITGKQLTARTYEGRRLYFDATFSAPKSVSIMALTMNDSELIRAHDWATQETLKELEKYAQTRVRINGADELRKTSNILVSSVTHTTSRANDPQIHSHNLVFNVTWDQVEEKFKALEASEIYQKTNYLTEIYRNKLAEKVIALGYEIESQRHGWEIKGVSPIIREKFSKRSISITNLSKEIEATLGRKLSNNEKSNITHQTRKKKEKSLNILEVIKNQKNELTRAEQNELGKVKNKALSIRLNLTNLKSHDELKDEKKELSRSSKDKLQEAYNFSKNHVFERTSIVKKEELLLTVLKQNYGEYSVQNIEDLMSKDLDLFVGLDDQVGSIEGLAKEVSIHQFIDKNLNKFEEKNILSNDLVSELKTDQLNAFYEILKNKDQVQILEGPAGTGKSFLLSKVVSAFEQNKIKTLSLAPTVGAVQSLKLDLKTDAETLQSFLLNHEKIINSYKDKNLYIILDEAGLVSTNEMEYLMKISEKYNLQTLLVGDTRQHHSVQSGDALRGIKKYSQIKVSSLESISRQKNRVYKQAVELIQNGEHEKAWDYLNNNNKIITHKLPNLSEIKSNVNREFVEKILDSSPLIKEYFNEEKKDQSILVITPTRFELNDLTEALRFKKYFNYSDQVLEREVYYSLRFTKAEKNNLNLYEINPLNPQYLSFYNKEKGFNKNELYKVIEKKDSMLYVQNEANDVIKVVDITKLNPDSFDVLSKKEIDIKLGEKLIIQKNNRALGFTNGEIVEVKSFNEKRIELKDGRILPLSENQFDYGYVTTSYASQGKTCDRVLISMTNRGGKAVSSEQFYVSASRGRHDLQIFVEDAEFIKSHITSLGHRKLNLEILNTNQKLQLSNLNDFKDLNLIKLKSELSNLISLNQKQQKEDPFKKYSVANDKKIKLLIKERSIDRIKSEFLRFIDKIVKDKFVNRNKNKSIDFEI